MTSTAIFIPARLASTRLPNKPLADIAGLPMIVQVLKRAEEADIGDVYVACAEQEIADAVKDHGGQAILTNPALPSGTDRIYAGLKQISQEYTHIINLQGDLPTIDPQAIASTLPPLENNAVDISTLVTVIEEEEEKSNPNVVKAVLSFTDSPNIGRALYFTRSQAPYGDGPLYHHIGIYGFKTEALKNFVTLPQTSLEKREKLEQLRALESGMRIDAAIVDSVPFGVDTQEDLEKAREILSS